MYTNHCVLSTCIGAADAGYRVIVPEDALGSWSADLHNKVAAFPLLTPLRWIVGEGLARDLCMTGRRFDATEAYRAGLVSEVVDGDKLMENACRLALTILEAPMHALRFIKPYMLDHASRGFEESFCIEHDRAFQEFLQMKKAESGNEK